MAELISKTEQAHVVEFSGEVPYPTWYMALDAALRLNDGTGGSAAKVVADADAFAAWIDDNRQSNTR